MGNRNSIANLQTEMEDIKTEVHNHKFRLESLEDMVKAMSLTFKDDLADRKKDRKEFRKLRKELKKERKESKEERMHMMQTLKTSMQHVNTKILEQSIEVEKGAFTKEDQRKIDTLVESICTDKDSVAVLVAGGLWDKNRKNVSGKGDCNEKLMPELENEENLEGFVRDLLYHYLGSSGMDTYKTISNITGSDDDNEECKGAVGGH